MPTREDDGPLPDFLVLRLRDDLEKARSEYRSRPVEPRHVRAALDIYRMLNESRRRTLDALDARHPWHSAVVRSIFHIARVFRDSEDEDERYPAWHDRQYEQFMAAIEGREQ